MATVTRSGDVVTLTMSTEEALYVTAELAGGNSYFHGVQPSFGELSDEEYDRGVFPALVDALRVSGGRRGPLATRYRKHQRVAEAARPQYDNVAGRKAAEREGFLVPEKV